MCKLLANSSAATIAGFWSFISRGPKGIAQRKGSVRGPNLMQSAGTSTIQVSRNLVSIDCVTFSEGRTDCPTAQPRAWMKRPLLKSSLPVHSVTLEREEEAAAASLSFGMPSSGSTHLHIAAGRHCADKHKICWQHGVGKKRLPFALSELWITRGSRGVFRYHC